MGKKESFGKMRFSQPKMHKIVSAQISLLRDLDRSIGQNYGEKRKQETNKQTLDIEKIAITVTVIDPVNNACLSFAFFSVSVSPTVYI